jgi:catechol 2,3-dioxygenase-like lactoylglutathione lyase family enzyme
MVQYQGIHHLALATNDMDKTVRFYRDILGMPLVATSGNRPGRSYRHYFFQLGPQQTIAFFEWPGMLEEFHKPAGLPARGPVQFDHVAFGVASVAELEKLQQELQRKGLEVTEIIDHGFCQSIYFTDPNGIALEASVWTEDIFDQPYHGDQQPVPAVFQEHDM